MRDRFGGVVSSDYRDTGQNVLKRGTKSATKTKRRIETDHAAVPSRAALSRRIQIRRGDCVYRLAHNDRSDQRPGEATMAARRTWPKDAPPVLTAALWASNLRDAQQVANLTMASDLRGARRDGSGRMSIDAAVATAAIHSAAGRLKIPIVENDVVLSRAKLAAGALSGALDAAQNDGTLKLFNKRYRKRRQAAQAEGRAFVSYGTARAKLESELARAAAGDIGGINFDRVFAATADEPAIK
jgi:hypothetical protein